MLSVFATEFEEHQSNTGQFDDVESISAYSTGSGNPYGLEFLTDQGSNYQITFSDSSGGSDSFNSPSISSVDGANFGGWRRVRDWRSGGSDYELHKKTTSTQEIASDAYRANVYAGGNITIEATALRNRSSTIEASGDITLTGTDLNNEKIRLLDVIDWRKVGGHGLRVGAMGSRTHLHRIILGITDDVQPMAGMIIRTVSVKVMRTAISIL